LNQRKEFNRKILELLLKEVEDNPEIRFKQLLISLKILEKFSSEEFNEESEESYKKIRNSVNRNKFLKESDK